MKQGGLANEVFLVEVNHASKSQFVGRIFLGGDERLLAAEVIHFDQQQSGLHARYVESQHARRVNVELLALVHQRVPNLHSIGPVNPDFVAQIAGVAGARNVHGHAGDFAASDAKIFQVRNIGFGYGFQQFARGRALQRQRCRFLGDVFDLNIHVQAVLPEPAQAGIGGRPAIGVLAEA